MMFLPEALEMEEYCRARPGRTMAGLEFFSEHPEHRLVLEGLVAGPGGCLYEEVPNENGCLRIPYHLGRERKFYLRRVKDNAVVQEFLELLNRLYDTPGATTSAGLRDARRRFLDLMKAGEAPAKALEGLAGYYESIVEALPELEDEGEIDGAELDEDGKPLRSGGATTRFQLIHKPYVEVKPDWVWSQSFEYRALYFRLRSVKHLDGLPAFSKQIRALGEDKVYNATQITVLWSAYKCRKNTLRDKEIELARQVGGFTCRRMLMNIKRYDSLGAIYNNVLVHLDGQFENDVWMPCDVTEREQKAIWMAFNVKKEAVV